METGDQPVFVHLRLVFKVLYLAKNVYCAVDTYYHIYLNFSIKLSIH